MPVAPMAVVVTAAAAEETSQADLERHRSRLIRSAEERA